MSNESFQEGFVQTCMNRGLNLQQTEDLMKVANYASAFHNQNFKEQFDSLVVKEASSSNLSMIAKAVLAKSAIDKFQAQTMAVGDAIDFEEVRLFIMDRAVDDNAIDLVANYFSDEEILAAMHRTAQAYNEIPPFHYTMKVQANKLPYKMYLLNGVGYYLYLSKLQKLSKEDLSYNAGGMQVELVSRRIKHFQSHLAMLKENMLQGAQAEKIADNYKGAYGRVG